MPLKPENGESKQDFLRRCADGDESRMVECTAEWNKARLAALVDDSVMTLTAPIELADPDQEEAAPRRFSILSHTGPVIDLGFYRFVIALDGMALAKDAVPALREHYRNQIVGTIDHSENAETGFFVSGRFSKATLAGKEVLALADEGFPWQASVGVRGLEVLEVADGHTYEVNGQTVTGPIDIWLKSEVFEVSFCPFGADDDTAAIAMHRAGGGRTTNKEASMPADKKLEKPTKGNGLPEEQQQAPAETPEENLDHGTGKKNEADLEQPSGGTVVVGLSGADVTSLIANGAQLGLSADAVTEALGDCKIALADARIKLFELAEKKNPPLGAGRFVPGADERDKLSLAMTDGVALRMGLSLDKPAAGNEEFRHMALFELAKFCLEREGEPVRGLSRTQIAENILRLSATSRSDFPGVFREAAHKRLLSAYGESPATWRPLVNVVPASDFREIHGIALSEGPDLDLVGENEEYTFGKLKEKQESYRIAKYGKKLALTLEMIVNDDLRAFARIPQLLGSAASRKTADIIWSLILANPVMGDGETLFSSIHKNIATTPGTVSKDGLSAGRKAMRMQKGLNGTTLDIRAKYLVTPVEQETDAEVLLRSTSLPETGMSAGVHNPHGGKLTPIAEPRLDDASSKAWYLVGDPNQIDTIEVAFLDGREEPVIAEKEDFDRDALVWKVRHIMGAGVMDHRGFYRNPGV
ncbi:hypothetical protein [Desulfovibrio oxyclinae]|uniref:phage major capsid protein n=1 Tax=Desulfovibrio oxyclinae TaxID=63560 RepID=UPI0003A790A5|nr:hypothetical protein [Desulfovibrio oxyclinae]